jgi:isoleucyl-tRNA synthetase
LSAFYFDIRKDTLYCDNTSSKKRKACINLLELILDMLLKWFAPILSFTTEEIFQILNHDQNTSIHLQSFPKIPLKWKNEELFKKWQKFKIIKKVVNTAIEEKRASKEIGSSLEANLIINLNKDLIEISKNVDFSELCIISSAVVKKSNTEELTVETIKAEGKKCPVCWKISKDKCARHSN